MRIYILQPNQYQLLRLLENYTILQDAKIVKRKYHLRSYS